MVWAGAPPGGRRSARRPRAAGQATVDSDVTSWVDWVAVHQERHHPQDPRSAAPVARRRPRDGSDFVDNALPITRVTHAALPTSVVRLRRHDCPSEMYISSS